jgi:hypothetical protein
MKARMRALLVAGLLIVAGFAFGQATDTADHEIQININHVAMIDLNNGGLLTLTTTDPAQAGEVFQGDSDSDRELYYTLLTASNGNIQAQLNNVGYDTAPPAGTLLYVEATSTSGTGSPGTVQPQITLTTTAQTIVGAIGTCYTGRAVDDGAQLLYTLAIDDPSLVTADDSATLQVIYTLSSAL